MLLSGQKYTRYISVTDSKYGDNVPEAFVEGKATAFSGNWADRGVSPGRLVYWPESHDTFSNPAFAPYVTLAKALNNYGYYSLPALQAQDGHKALEQLYSEPALPDTEALLSQLESKKAALTKSGDVTAMNYSLNLESEIALNLYVTSDSAVTAAEVDKRTVEITEPARLEDGRSLGLLQ